jgi:hypothetical protein
MPRSVVAEADPNAARSVVAGDEPPNVRVIVPTWVHEDVVHPFDDAVAVNPDVLTVRIAPIAVDPDASLASRGGLVHGHHAPRRWRYVGCSHGLRLLDHDDRLPLDLLRDTFLDLDDHVARRLGCHRRLFAGGLLARSVTIV